MNLVLFDGECNLCHAGVLKIIRYDKNNLIQFASQQSDVGKAIMLKNGLQEMDSIVFISEGQVFIKSNVVIAICALLKGKIYYAKYLKIVPKCIRDFAYDIVAKNRYRFFGKKENCMLPTIEIKAKFL
jgi:predicted DCC family thiol-disulfide oxidoreductase YuxK